MNDMRNALNYGVWKKALKLAVSSASGIILGNILDPIAGNFWSWEFWVHCLKVTAAVTFINELRFWKEWADTPETIPQAIQRQATQEIDAFKKNGNG